MASTHAERRRWPRRGEPERLAPTADPAEAVERLVSRRQLIIENGDVIVARKPAGLTAHRFTTSLPGESPATSQYCLSLRGPAGDHPRVFASYERAVMDGEAYASRYHVRLFYVENGVLTLLMDCRPAR